MTEGSTGTAVRRPFHPVLFPVPFVCFIGALFTDLAYYTSAEMMWADFSSWLLVVGVVFGAIAAVVVLFDIFSNRMAGADGWVWLYFLLALVALVVGFFNALIHTRDAWTSVVPIGLALSGLTVLVLIGAGWARWVMARFHVFGRIR